jgi:tetratricopeptide (TPR) repeat protein
MILDDEGSIQLHDPVHGLANFFKDWAGYNYLPNRAFGYLTFAINYEFGGLNPFGYHIVNLAIHILTGLLAYSLVRLIFRTPYMQHAGVLPDHVEMFAFVVALFFVCHPVQTQAVTYIVQRLTTLTTMFYLATLVCYLKWRMPEPEAPSSSPQRFAWYLLALLSTILAMKTKEISFTLPVMILLLECSFFGLPARHQLVKMTPLLLTILIIPLTTYFRIAPLIESTQGGGSFLSDVNTPAYNIVRVTRPEYLYTQFSVLVTYLRLMFFPVNQHLDYDYPINHSLLEPRPLLSLLLLLSIFLFAIIMFLKSRQNLGQTVLGNQFFAPPASPMLRIAAFGIFWFFLTLSVESSIIVIQDVIYEHRLYLPSFGFFLSLTALGALVMKGLKNRFEWLQKLIFAAVACIAVILSVATYSRNNVWRDWITLWSDNVAKAPAKPRPHNILGIGYFYIGKYDEAMREYKEAARLKPDFIEAYYNMGLLHNAKKEHKEAIIMFMKVLGMSAFNATQHAKAYNEIGINYAELGNPDQAVAAFAAAVKYEPESIEFRNNYAFALMLKGDRNAAVKECLTVLNLSPGNAHAMEMLQELKSKSSGEAKK